MENLLICKKDDLQAIIAEALTSARKEWESSNRQAKQAQTGYITRKQAAEMLHVSLPTLHAWVHQGRLKCYQIGGRTLYKREEVMQAVQPATYSIK